MFGCDLEGQVFGKFLSSLNDEIAVRFFIFSGRLCGGTGPGVCLFDTLFCMNLIFFVDSQMTRILPTDHRLRGLYRCKSC